MVRSTEELAQLGELFPDLLGPGAPFELAFEEVLGASIPVWINRAPSMREVLLKSGEHGSHPYLITDEKTVTYAQNLAAATTLGAVLRDKYGVQPGDRVAILGSNSPDWVTAFWASQWAGAVGVAFNAWWSGPEVAFALDHCAPAVIVADRRRRELLAGSDVPVIAMEDLADLADPADEGAMDIDIAADEDAPAVIVYTSGTTGRPKGVVHTHRNLAAVINFHGLNDGLARMFGVPDDPPRRDFMILPLFHIASLHNLSVARLGQGTSIVMYEGRFEPERVLATLERHRVTNWGAVPTMARRLIKDADPSGYDLSALRQFALASAPSTPAFHAELRQVIPVAQALANSYGLTESATAITVASAVDLGEDPASVGKPIVGVQAEVRDLNGKAVPDGQPGEVWARSQFNMLEYWNDPDATAETITPDRWMRTGDLGRFVNGQLHLDIRRSDLIIRGGENISPAEVEQRLLEHPAVGECLVLGVEDPDLGQEVAAVVTLAPDASVTKDELAGFAKEGLAYFKVPRHWHLTTDELPRNATGKVSRPQLAALFEGASG